MNADQAVAGRPYLYSRLASDVDLREIVDLFVEEMPDRIAMLLNQLDTSDWENLQRTAHQLKGAAGSYGFDMISPCAGMVESAIRNGEPEEQIRMSVKELVEMCGRIRSGVPNSMS